MEKRLMDAMIHSKKEVGLVELVEKRGDNEYVVITPAGVKCMAIFNWFTGLYYADDLYAVLDK